MVNIDTVYQKVLMIANKEQRGYITPQEFNLFADHAQKEIFEQYFYDLEQYMRLHSDAEEYSNIVHNINEKIAIFEKQQTITVGPLGGALTSDVYRLGTVYWTDLDGNSHEIEEVEYNEFLYMNQNPISPKYKNLLAPTNKRRIYVRTGANTIAVYPHIVNVDYTYTAIPAKPNWAYVVVNGKAMYDSSNTINFELHPAEEGELIYKILKIAGVSMKRDDIMRAGQGLDMAQVQLEKQ